MKVLFIASEGHNYDNHVSNAFAKGCTEDLTIISTREGKRLGVLHKYDIVVLGGVKSKPYLFKNYKEAGKQIIFIDKGYTRLSGGPLNILYFRVSLDEFQPFYFLNRENRLSDRWNKLGKKIKPVNLKKDGSIIYAGSSEKFHMWHGLKEPTQYAKNIISEIKKHSKREIIYRPKPTWKYARKIKGVRHSGPKEKLKDLLNNCRVLVTNGSNACFEALINGVPTIVLGDGVTKSLSSTKIEEIENPKIPTRDQVHQLAYNLAYWQYTLEEMEKGVLWNHLLPYLKKK